MKQIVHMISYLESKEVGGVDKDGPTNMRIDIVE